MIAILLINMYHTVLKQIKQQVLINYHIFIPDEIINLIRLFCLDQCLPKLVLHELHRLYSNIISENFADNLRKCTDIVSVWNTFPNFNTIKINISCSLNNIIHLDSVRYYYYNPHKPTNPIYTWCKYIYCSDHIACTKYYFFRSKTTTLNHDTLVEMGFNPKGFFIKNYKYTITLEYHVISIKHFYY